MAKHKKYPGSLVPTAPYDEEDIPRLELEPIELILKVEEENGEEIVTVSFAQAGTPIGRESGMRPLNKYQLLTVIVDQRELPDVSPDDEIAFYRVKNSDNV